MGRKPKKDVFNDDTVPNIHAKLPVVAGPETENV